MSSDSESDNELEIYDSDADLSDGVGEELPQVGLNVPQENEIRPYQCEPERAEGEELAANLHVHGRR